MARPFEGAASAGVNELERYRGPGTAPSGGALQGGGYRGHQDRPDVGRLFGQIQRAGELNVALRNLVDRLNKQMDTLSGGEPEPTANGKGSQTEPSSAINALAAGLSTYEALLGYLEHQVQRLERL